MLLGEVSPGGVGSGLYGMLMMAVLATFVAGLMVGRTPEFLGKKIGAREMTYVALYVLTIAGPGAGRSRHGDGAAEHAGRDEQRRASTASPRSFYAYASAANNNGSAFAGITVTSTFFQLTLGRGHADRPVRADRAGARPGRVAGPEPASCRRPPGTLPTHTPLFVTLLDRRGAAGQRSHLLPGARARADRGGTAHEQDVTQTGRRTRRPPRRSSTASGPTSGTSASARQLIKRPARRVAQAGSAAPVALAGDVRRLARVDR